MVDSPTHSPFNGPDSSNLVTAGSTRSMEGISLIPLFNHSSFSSTLYSFLLSLHSRWFSSDDGSRIYVNDTLVMDAWYDRSLTETSGTISLVQGRNYSIVFQVPSFLFLSSSFTYLHLPFFLVVLHIYLLFLQYYEHSGGAEVHLSWSTACEAKAIIPQSQLFSS